MRKREKRRLLRRQRVPVRRVNGRLYRAKPNLIPILIETKAACEEVLVELNPGRPGWRPYGFWRKKVFHRIARPFGNNFEKGVFHIRVQSEDGKVYELRRSVVVDPWTWKRSWRWELLAEIVVRYRPRLPADPNRWYWPEEARR